MEYAAFLPELSPDVWRRVRGNQELVVLHDPDHALKTLPALLDDRADRSRLRALAEKLRARKLLLRAKPTAGQAAMLDRIRTVLGTVAEDQ